MKIGYARVSRADQNLELQTEALKAAGIDRIYKDRESGAKADRVGLDEMTKTLRAGDVVCVWRLDRLARSMQHLIELMRTFEAAGVQLVSLTENIDTSSPTGRLVFHLFASIAEFERNLIIERTSAGLEAARRKGRVGGRKPVLDSIKRDAVKKMLEEARTAGSEPNYKLIAHTVGVSDRTVRRVDRGEYERFL
jgi:DNA invertase Pin-like site-specific DNA recombinase